jgi:hypothetical protein
VTDQASREDGFFADAALVLADRLAEADPSRSSAEHLVSALEEATGEDWSWILRARAELAGSRAEAA